MGHGSRKTMGFLALTGGLAGVVAFSYTIATTRILDGLPGDERAYPIEHPLRWMAMNLGFWVSAVVLFVGLALVWLRKYNRQADANPRKEDRQ